MSDCLIGVSAATIDDLVRMRIAPAERFQTIPVGVELEPFTNLSPHTGDAFRRRFGIGSDETVLSYVGRFAPIKRLDILLRAVARGRQEGLRIRLIMVGDGTERACVLAQLASLGIQESVSILGYSREVPSVAAATDIAVLSSDNEGTPVWLIEAAAASVPAVATDVGGVSDVVSRKGGIVVPPGDVRAFATAIARLVGDPTRRRSMGLEARQHVLSHFTADRLIDDVAALYWAS